MAIDVIAAALRGGKGAPVLDRAAIFRSAHEHALRELTWEGKRWTYRKAFSIALRAVYFAEKQAAEERAYLAALPPVPPEIEDRARELSAWADGCRIDGPGNAMFSKLKAEARDLIDAARRFC